MGISSKLKHSSISGLFRHAFFIALCVISVIYYKERTLNFDPAFFSWLLFLNEEFFFALGRNGAILGQLLPLLFVKMGMSIKTVLVVFSLSFALWYYIFFLITEYVTRDKVASWVLILALCLTFRQTFFYTTAEVYHGMALGIVLWSLLRRSYDLVSPNKYIVYIVVLAGTFWLPFFHQINSLLWLFLLGLEYLDRRNYKDIKLLSLIFIAAAWFVARIKFFSLSEYEKGKLLTIDDHLYALDNFFELPSYVYFQEWAVAEMTIPFIFFAGCLLFAIGRSKFLISAYIIAALTGFIVLIINTNFRGESPIMFENYYSLFGLFMAAAWAVAIRGIKLSGGITAVLIGLTVFSVVEIVQSVWMYQQRISYLRRLTDYATRSDDDKFIINAKNFPVAYATVPWALAFETAFYSEIDKNPGASSFFLSEDPDAIMELENVPNFLSAPWENAWFGLGHVKSKGFGFTDRPYRLANTARDTAFSTNEFSVFQRSFSIIPDYSEINIRHSIHLTNVYILNESGQTLHSLPDGPNQTKIGYRIFQNGVVAAESLMPLEVDILPDESFVSGVIVRKPIDFTKGTITFGMYTEGFGWWGLSTPISIKVESD